VKIFDQDKEQLDSALASIGRAMSELHDHGLLANEPQYLCNNITCADTLDRVLYDADYVQESVAENITVKKNLFAEFDKLTKPTCVLASSTSTIPTSIFSDGLEGADRCLVAHPVNPPHLIPLVEISPGPKTRHAITQKAFKLHESVHQTPILVKQEIRGFILNRLQAAVLLESWDLVKNGYVSIEDLDKTMKDGLGLRWSFMGPFETVDLNSSKGIREYASIFGQTYNEMMEKCSYPVWGETEIDRVTTARRSVLKIEDIEERSRWRDRKLLQHAKLRNKLTKK
tara:strand:- start:734 stop:1588 length:855 start_codon:yes stop_codon:yes gene_type:complete